MEYPKGFEGERLREICALRCGDYGEPACWRLPDLTSDCSPDEITPCDECKEIRRREALAALAALDADYI